MKSLKAVLDAKVSMFAQNCVLKLHHKMMPDCPMCAPVAVQCRCPVGSLFSFCLSLPALMPQYWLTAA